MGGALTVLYGTTTCTCMTCRCMVCDVMFTIHMYSTGSVHMYMYMLVMIGYAHDVYFTYYYLWEFYDRICTEANNSNSLCEN